MNGSQLNIVTPVNEWPLIGAIDLTNDKARVPMQVSSSLVWFAGHFPGQPVLPGVVQVHWAINLATALFTELAVFSAISNLKFNSVIVPESQITLTLFFNREKKSVAFVYGQDETTFSSGTIIFAAL